MATATKKAKKAEAKGPGKATAEPAAPIVLGIVPKGELRSIPLRAIADPPGEPDRMDRPGDAERILETARSLREVGQLQPIMVEQIGDAKYQRVFGRRRLAAALHNAALARAVFTLAVSVMAYACAIGYIAAMIWMGGRR